jgi:transcriptional regulator with XRE-family HTH domain
MEQQPESKRQIIAERVREARRMSGLSQGQVAKMLGLQRPSVTEMEAGNRGVSAEELAKLAEVYDVSVSWLLGEGAERSDAKDARLQLAARELTKLKPEDLDRLMAILAALREQEGKA